jgi:succinoglycan biosynthesis transport protein ExoP
MTRAATPSSTPRPAPSQQRPRSPGPMLDPIRVLRQNLAKISAALAIGSVAGVGLNYVFGIVYPLWSSKVLFELKSQLEDANALAAKDITTEDTVVRLAQTEVARLTSKDNLKAALGRPEVQKTVWSDQYRDANGVFILEDALLDLEDDLRSGHQRGTQIFYISMLTHVPEDGPIILNAIAKTFRARRQNDEDSRYSTTLKQFENRRQQLDDAILQKKQQVQDFIKKNRLTSLTEANSENQRTLEKLRNDIAQTTADLNIAQSRRAQIEKKQRNEQGISDDDRRRAQEDPILLQLQRDNEDLSRRFAAVRQQFGASHPDYLQLRAQTDASRAAFERKLEEVLARNLAADYKDAFNKEESLTSLLKQQNEDFDKATGKVEDFTANMAEMRSLEDQLDILQEQRKEIGKTIQDINLALARDERNRIEIVQEAIKAREITFPQLKVMIPATAVLVTGLYVLILFVREFLDQRVKYPSDLGALPGKLLGVIPELKDDPAKPKRAEQVARESPRSIIAENYRQLSSQVYKGMQALGARTLLVVSAMPEAGTTTVSINLAVCEAAVGRRVLLVGANMRRPGLARAFDLPHGQPGLGEALAGQDPADLVVEVSPGLFVLGAGAPANRIFERLNSERTDQVLLWAREHFDLVIVDGPPSIVAGESLVLANKVDAAIVVACAWKDQRGLVMKLASQIMDSRAQFLGAVLNRMRMMAGGYLRKNAEAMAEYAEHTTAFGGEDRDPAPSKRKKGKPKAA